MNHSSPFWCTRRLLVTVEGPQGTSVIPLARPFARIGRQPGSDVVLESPWISKRSVYLHATDEGIFCVYMQPEETNAQRIGYWLGAGEPVLVGPYRISAALEGDPPGPAPAFVPLDEWGSATPPYPVFQVSSGGKLRDKRKFRARLNLIGRRHECALQIKGQQVSAFHGCLYWNQGRLWYVDLASSNGSSINGAPVDCGEIRVGDTLAVGEFTLLFQRLSRGSSQSSPAASQPTEGLNIKRDAILQLPADFEEDSPPDLDEQIALEPEGSQVSETADSAPIIAAIQEQHQRDGAASSSEAAVKNGEELAPMLQSRQELAELQKRVEELTQLTAQAGQRAAQQLAQKTREAFERERQRIAQELERRARELAKEKQALESQWHTASRELATQVTQLRDEASLLATQRQAMEQSRLEWEEQRTELELQLRSYAEQLHRLEQGAGNGLPAPAAAALALPSGNRPAPVTQPATLAEAFPRLNLSTGNPNGQTHAHDAALVPSAGSGNGTLTARSQIVDAHVDSPLSGAGKGTLLLEGSLATDAVPEKSDDKSTEPMRMRREMSDPLAIKGRKATAKATRAFEAVTDHIVEREYRRHRMMLIVGAIVTLAVVALTATLLVAAFYKP